MARKTIFAALALIFLAASGFATDISLKISGPGAVNDSTIKAGEKVSVDIYWVNDRELRGFTCGFKVVSKDIKTVTHPADSAGGINGGGDIKGFNGWGDKSVWDLNGIFVVERSWDGQLPDTVGFGGAVVKKRYTAHDLQKVLSFDLVVPTTGTIVIDSAFYPPGGFWKAVGPPDTPQVSPGWGGPYTFKVVK